METVDTSTWLKPDLPLPLLRSERDRDVFDLGNALLIVASDRLSVSGCTLPEGISGKGRVLTRIAQFWFNATRDIVPNHLVQGNSAGLLEALRPFREVLEGRSLLARRIKPIALGCTVRGYLAGSAFEEYQAKGSVCGIALPPRIKLAGRLPEPIFTPSVSAEDGRRRNITMAEMMSLVGAHATMRLKECSLALYMRGYHLAWERDIILADARFEFGLLENGKLILTDEALTPDTSRYWSEDRWKPGMLPPSSGRRCLQEYLETRLGWDGHPPAPHLPPEIQEGIRNDYLELGRRFGAAS